MKERALSEYKTRSWAKVYQKSKESHHILVGLISGKKCFLTFEVQNTFMISNIQVTVKNKSKAHKESRRTTQSLLNGFLSRGVLFENRFSGQDSSNLKRNKLWLFILIRKIHILKKWHSVHRKNQIKVCKHAKHRNWRHYIASWEEIPRLTENEIECPSFEGFSCLVGLLKQGHQNPR